MVRRQIRSLIRCAVVICTLGAAFSACSGNVVDAPSPISTSPPPLLIPTTEPPPVFVGAGDIAYCGIPGAELTARLLDRISGTVFTTGDNAYLNASDADFKNCYHPTWGRHLERTRPVPGNHEYRTAGASGYFNYFGPAAGPYGLGYYTYELGSWLVLALNSEVDMRPASAQGQWLRDQLSTNRKKCTVAIFHRPFYSSGPNGRNLDTVEFWRVLYEFDVDIVINGHDHIYERFAPQNPDGFADPVRGIRQFTVGTGGGPTNALIRRSPNSETGEGVWGVLALTLQPDAYKWEFVPVEGVSFRDSGTGTCH